MTTTLIFDVNETLLDLAVLDSRFEAAFGDAGARSEWFARLLEAAFVTTVVGRYHDFGEVGRTSLRTVARGRSVDLDDETVMNIVGGMRTLPAHREVPAALERLRAGGFRLAALTNSPPDTAHAQLDHAELAPFFEAILSVDAAKALKPAAAAYQSALHALQVAPEEAWMVAAHDWDIIGAMSVGCRGAYLARSKPYHDLYPPPDLVADDLAGLADALL